MAKSPHPAPPPPPPIREVREGFTPRAIANFYWFVSGAIFASLVWGAMA